MLNNAVPVPSYGVGPLLYLGTDPSPICWGSSRVRGKPITHWVMRDVIQNIYYTPARENSCESEIQKALKNSDLALVNVSRKNFYFAQDFVYYFTVTMEHMLRIFTVASLLLSVLFFRGVRSKYLLSYFECYRQSLSRDGRSGIDHREPRHVSPYGGQVFGIQSSAFSSKNTRRYQGWSHVPSCGKHGNVIYVKLLKRNVLHCFVWHRLPAGVLSKLI